MKISRAFLIALPIVIVIIAYVLLHSSLFQQSAAPLPVDLVQPNGAQVGLNATSNASNASAKPLPLGSNSTVPVAKSNITNASGNTSAPKIISINTTAAGNATRNVSATVNATANVTLTANGTVPQQSNPQFPSNLVCARSPVDWFYLAGNASANWTCGVSGSATGSISYTTVSHSGNRAVNITVSSVGPSYDSAGSLYSYYELPALSPGHYHVSVWMMSPTNSSYLFGIQQLSDWSYTACIGSGKIHDSRWALYTCDVWITQVLQQGYILPIVLNGAGTLIWDDLTLTESNDQYTSYSVYNFTI